MADILDELSVNKDYQVSATDMNSLFNKLEEIRLKHVAKGVNSGSALTSLNSLGEFKSPPMEANKQAQGEKNGDISTPEQPRPHNLMRSYLNVLRSSRWLSSVISANDINQIEIPPASTLIDADNYSRMVKLIAKADGAATYANNFAFRFTCSGNNGGFSRPSSSPPAGNSGVNSSPFTCLGVFEVTGGDYSRNTCSGKRAGDSYNRGLFPNDSREPGRNWSHQAR